MAGTTSALLHSPVFWITAAVLFAVLWIYADARTPAGKRLLGLTHAAAHLVVMIALVSFLPPLNAGLAARAGLDRWSPGWFEPGTLSYFFLYAGEMIVIGGFAASFIWGIYLWLTCAISGIHDNDAFSAMRLGRYRHFLRLRIKGEELTVYPIGIDRPPRRHGWQWNPLRSKGDQNQPEVIPNKSLGEYLIEGPIVIRAPAPKKKPAAAGAESKAAAC